ncbi:serine/threonine-protein kinase [Actinomadura violacea]|uniref:serine/threonine-protein kinase n=1 Tax=Actinomadura violacea TaxID=2819934 RepID=UPI001E5C5FBC|nr:serine/threonine-protein kinase [Actinomadura violacea]
MTRSKPLTSRDPERIGEHSLLGRLGEGGQGVVYLAEDPSGRQVALKVLHDRGGSRDGFLRETSAARKVAPFCTAEILHVGEDDDLPYVVTELIDGPSLRELVDEKGPQDGPALYRLAIGTATALAAIHQAGVVHRDFKPGNVLVGPDGPRVIDFGIARSMDATLTATSSIVGTPSYMAPEQLAGEPVGPPADVFAWGATIAYAANGRPPYGQDTIPAVMNRIVKGKPDLGGLTGPLRDLVAESLHKDPSRRPESRGLLLRLLEHSQGPIAASEALAEGRALAMADDRTLANRTARWATAPRPTRPLFQRRVLLAGIATATVLLVLTTALAVRQAPSGRSAASPRTTGAAAPPAQPTAPKDVAAAVEQAVSQRKTAAFTANGQIADGNDSFVSHGRLHFRPGSSTNYDLTVRNPDSETESSDARIILLGNCGYLRSEPQRCRPTNGQQMDAYAFLASEVRWVTSPYDILELLRNSTALKRDTDSGTITYRGSTRLAPLIDDGPVAPFYRIFSSRVTNITFTLVTARDHLPERLDIDLWTRIDPRITAHSLYSATYTDWGKSGTITRAY